MSRVLIFANGELPDLARARALLHPDDLILCADGGTQHALALGVTPELIIGDLDSLTQEAQALLEGQGVRIVQHPRDKNETDLELTLQHALERQPSSILIIGALGNRLDQMLANLALVSDSKFSGIDVRLDDGVEEAFFCRGRSEVRGAAGDLVSLIPWGQPVVGVRTENLKWPLDGETLYPQGTRGISNELLRETAAVSLSSGLLLVVHRRQ